MYGKTKVHYAEPGEPVGIDCTFTLLDLRHYHENFMIHSLIAPKQ